MSGSIGGSLSGTTSGGVGGTVGGSNPVDGFCERKVSSAGPVQPDIMIVLDRSGSMRPEADGLDCRVLSFDTVTCFALGINCSNQQYANTTVCGGQEPFGLDRWNPAVKGLKSITSQFQDKVSFGLTTFPGTGMQGRNSCITGTERVPVSINSAAMIASALDMTSPEGNTPTGPTLEAVRQQIEMKTTTPDSVVPPQYVLLVTDGQPTCPGSGSEARASTIAALDALLAAGVKTYVIGYDASVDPELANALTDFAKHGGTEKFYPVQDEASLVEQFKTITGVVAACSYKLDSVPANPDYVKVSIDMEQVYLGKGFSLQGANVILEGASCDKLRDGGAHILDVSVECVPQVPLL